MEAPRFKVIEVDGYACHVNPTRPSGHTAQLLSCSVLDTAYGYREVARFNQEDVGKRVGREAMRELARQRAHARAADLNAEHAE